VTERRKRRITPTEAHADLERAGQLALPFGPAGERRLDVAALVAAHRDLTAHPRRKRRTR
jgi:hypothetical protein